MDSLHQNITQALGWSMVHSLWQGALTYGALCLIYLLFPKLTSKSKYALALWGQFLLSLAFVITFGHYLDTASTPNEAPVHYKGALSISLEAPSSILNVLDPLLPWMSSIYVLGLSFQLVIFSSGLSKLHYLKTRGLSVVPTTWNESLLAICSKLQIKQRVRFHLSEKVSVPMVLGHLKPIILFPVALVSNLELAQVEAILTHELAHIKRRDYLLNLLKVAIETILFFNPFVWLLSRHIETEREHACDDIVMMWTLSPIAYAQALMSVELLKTTPVPMHAMAAVGKKYHLLHRMQRITNMEKKRIHARQHFIAVLLCSFALTAVAWITPKEQPIIAAENANNLLIVEAPVTTHQIPPPVTAPDYPPLIQDSIKLRRKSEKMLTDNMKNMEVEAKKIEAHYNSPEWKEKVADIETQAKRAGEYFNSPEWKAKIADIEANARKIETYYNSPEWKEKVADIEIQAKRAGEYFNSPEWKAKIADIEANARKIETYYNSPEWKEKVADIEIQAKRAGEYFNSPKWKAKIADIEANAKEIAEHYVSP